MGAAGRDDGAAVRCCLTLVLGMFAVVMLAVGLFLVLIGNLR